jgi:hypothetical protein
VILKVDHSRSKLGKETLKDLNLATFRIDLENIDFVQPYALKRGGSVA